MFRKTLIDVTHGIYSTRVYIVLLSIGVLILTVYSFITMHIKNVTIHNPTFKQFEQLQPQNATLSCPCQHFSMPLSSVITVQPIFHEVCSSSFVDNNGWLKYWPLISINKSEPIIYAFDFRQSGARFFKLLQAFCHVTTELVTNAVNTFGSIQLFSTQAITEDEFSSHTEYFSMTFFFQVTFKSLYSIDSSMF